MSSTVTFPTGPLSPYVTPEILTTAPTGISWSTIPPGTGTTPAQRYAEQSNLCARATAQADSYCNQTLRATLNTEVFRGPNFRSVVLNGSKNGRVVLQRWPVLSVTNVQVAPDAIFPRQWTVLPAGYYEPEFPPIGIYGSSAPAGDAEGGQAIILAPGYLNWSLGRQGWIIQVTYYNGWPHCGLTAAATAGDSVIVVDDCTGWALETPFSDVTGAVGTVYDSGQQEAVTATATSATSGPGTITLAAPLTFSHAAGTVVSTLPQSVMWAVVLFATSMALTRGATATTVQSIPGGSSSTGGSSKPSTITEQAQSLLAPFRRVV